MTCSIHTNFNFERAMWWILWNNIIKRLTDILLSLMALLVLSPIIMICAIWVKFDSDGPVIFKQRRLTRNGKVFYMYKFRTMVQNAEQQGTGLFNYKGDPRVTRCGRILRDYSLDELPQLVNILKGDMSIVGPRPCVEYELGDYQTLNHRYKKRFEFKAGLTGYAQCQGRNELDWDIKVDFDNRYIDLYKKWGILLDTYIIFKTFASIFHHKDIYENKIETNMSDEQSAEVAQQRVVAMAHQQDNI